MSLSFTPLYDLIIDALDDAAARQVCRQVLRQEYPDPGGNTPSHREDLVHDLVDLGIDLEEVRRAAPTSATIRSIGASFELVRTARDLGQGDIAVLATAACYGESLVASEYQAILPRVMNDSGGRASRFFGPHAVHDEQHADLILRLAGPLIAVAPSEYQVFHDAVDRCVSVKRIFYRQFGLV